MEKVEIKKEKPKEIVGIPITEKIVFVEVANCSRLNLRKAPSMAADVLFVAKRGMLLQLLEETNKEWIKVNNTDGIEGFVKSEFIKR